MHSWKKMKKKLTHFLSDHSPPPSPSSSSSSSSSSPSSTSSDHDQTRSPFKDDSYMSSMLSFFFPSNESISKKNEDYTEPTQSLKSIKCGTSKAWDPKEENGDQNSARSISSPEVFEDAIDLRTPKKYIPDQNLDSVFVSPELYQFFQSCLPNIVKGCRWVLLYSTVKHGISLRTLIRNSCDLPGPCLLITGDTKGAVFGGLLNSPLTPTPQRKYQGTFQTFVFTTLYGPPTLFRPTGANRYFYMCLNDLLAFGGGGSFALRLDGDLLMGTSGPCDTFGNQHLAHSEEFELKNVELWGFTHSSRYRS
ncbi:oxidation resistance protein 1-like isoform X2 [Cynara cardunculus var. scolymus]|uniref:oxidation resistance protein 1-like isoform X2 n=1 Tax=Cynara cardunculus var. scolymus TaxID=59895 RepID=UPI000D625B08|nr:oxidation resistance protein 1-like isoform X2 [Cynara cardunculus var. scolymus]